MGEPIYTATATSSGDGRNGWVRTAEGYIDQRVRIPSSFGGQGGATNPEELFAAAYAVCFTTHFDLLRRVSMSRSVTTRQLMWRSASALTNQLRAQSYDHCAFARRRHCTSRGAAGGGPPDLPVFQGDAWQYSGRPPKRVGTALTMAAAPGAETYRDAHAVLAVLAVLAGRLPPSGLYVRKGAHDIPDHLHIRLPRS